jgi:peptidoglycan/xylan/chitin deacetylase (PgdA/CDA1 family)
MHRTGWLKKLAPAGGCAVVNYHGVIPPGYTSSDSFLDGNLVTLENLQKQLRFLKANYTVLQPADFREWLVHGQTIPARAVLVTCDDGLLNHLVDMLPVFQAEGVECLFFLTGASCSENHGMLWYEELYRLLRSDEIGNDEKWRALFGNEMTVPPSSSFQSLWWNIVLKASRLGADERAERMTLLRKLARDDKSLIFERRWRVMNIRELIALAQAGATIGAHTMTHPVLCEAAQEECFREIHESKVAIERALGKTIWAFAYPFGNPAAMGAREVEMARRAGFECAFVNTGGGFSDRSDPFTISRTHVTADMTVAELEAHMTGFHTRLQKAARG